MLHLSVGQLWIIGLLIGCVCVLILACTPWNGPHSPNHEDEEP